MKFDLTNSGIKSYIDDLNRRLNDISEDAAKDFFENVKDLTPVRTGRMKNAWELHGTEVDNDTPYLYYVNDGTSRQAGQHFIERALFKTGDKYK